MIRTNDHSATWLKAFQKAVCEMPEIISAQRMTGDLDYVLRVRVVDVPAYDRFYQRLIDKVQIADVSASFVMEEVKETVAQTRHKLSKPQFVLMKKVFRSVPLTLTVYRAGA